MRVLVATAAIKALGPLQAGTALAVPWADLGAQVAVVPLGEAGAGFAQAVADFERVDPSLLPLGANAPVAVCVDAPGATVVALEGSQPGAGVPICASSAWLGQAVAQAVTELHPQTLYVDLAWACGTHDAGAGLLAGLGARGDGLRGGLEGLRDVGPVDLEPARELLAGIDLVGVAPAGELGKPLLGLRGISSTRGYAAGLDLEATLDLDAVLERYCAQVGPDAAGHPDAGACGGAGFAIAALGGRLTSGVGLCAERGGLRSSLEVCDLVVTGCDRFDFHTRGGPVVEYLAETAADAGVPLIVVADERMIGNREMRTFGVENAYALDLGDPTPESVIEAVRPIARSWIW